MEKQLNLIDMIRECEIERGSKSNYSKRDWSGYTEVEKDSTDNRPWL